MTINFPNDPATSPGDGGQWTDADGNLWQVEIVSGEAVWTMIQAAGSDDGGGGAVSSVAGKTGDVLLGLEDLMDIELDASNGNAQIVSIVNQGGQGTTSCFNPNSFSIYQYAGIRVRADGAAQFVGGSGSSNGERSCVLSKDAEIQFSNSPISTGDDNYTVKVEVTDTDGDAMSYRAAPTLGTDATDLVIPTMGQVRGAIAANGGTSVSLNDLSDCSYTQKGSDDSYTLEPLNLDEITFTGEDTPNGISRKIYTSATLGFGLTSWNGTTGSFLLVHETNDVCIKTSKQEGVVWIQGADIQGQYNQPELRFNSGNSDFLDGPATSWGKYIGFKMPAGVTEDVTWTLPGTDGLSGYVLSTDGAGNLTFAAPPNPAQAVRTYEIDYESTTAYKFTGPGLDGTELNPTLIVNRGDTYIFSNVLGAHPFQLQTVAGTGESPYTDGVTGDQPISVGQFSWTVPMDAPGTIFYQCTAHAAMAGSIHVLDNSGGGGGGGAVDSVNSQTGVVSLGAFDLTDVSKKILPGRYTLTNKDDTPASANEWNVSNANGRGYFKFPVSSGSEMGKLQVGADVRFQSSGVADHVSTVYSAISSGVPRDIQINDEWPAEWLALPNGSDVDVVADAFAPTEAPPVDGEVLQWNGPANEFRPAAVANSVNGETGEVSLGIQDMNDFDLNEAGNAFDGCSNKVNSTPENSGEYWIYPEGQYGKNLTINIAQADDLGVLEVGDTITYKVQGLDDFSTTVAETIKFHGPNSRWLVNTLDWPDGWRELPIGTPLLILNEKFPGVDVPLYDGDILQWNNVDQKFKPAQIAAGGAVDSVNGETGVVSLGIQDMDDFALNPAENQSAYHDKKTTASWDKVDDFVGGFGIQGDNEVLIHWDEPTSGVSLEDQGWEAGDPTLWISKDGLTWTSHTGTSRKTGGSAVFEDLIPNVSAYLSDSALYFSVIGPGAGEDLAEGDILQWDDADQKFKPAPLAVAGPQRKTVQIVETLDSQETKTGEVTGTGGSGLLLTIQTSVPVWIRLYTDTTSSSTDASRTQADDPPPGSGVLFEALYSTVTEKVITPGTTYFNKADNADSLYYAVTNVGATDGAVTTINLKILPLEN